ncbi:hypothetical protein B0H14DRAFT_2650466 [Mycena olivaceomarginata]|nr:hypothetical protein B0H14DRAFT_2650466 [Mycena olivaceomarginata]
MSGASDLRCLMPGVTDTDRPMVSFEIFDIMVNQCFQTKQEVHYHRRHPPGLNGGINDQGLWGVINRDPRTIYKTLNLGQNNILPEHPITLRYMSEMRSTIHRSRQAIDAVEWNTAYCRMSKMIRGFWAAHAVKKRRSLSEYKLGYIGGPLQVRAHILCVRAGWRAMGKASLSPVQIPESSNCTRRERSRQNTATNVRKFPK